MQFAVVIFPGNPETVEVILSQWLISDHQCYFPPTADYTRSIKKGVIDKSWKTYKTRIVAKFGKFIIRFS